MVRVGHLCVPLTSGHDAVDFDQENPEAMALAIAASALMPQRSQAITVLSAICDTHTAWIWPYVPAIRQRFTPNIQVGVDPEEVLDIQWQVRALSFRQL